MPTAFLDQIRHSSLDDLGQPVRRFTARGGEPCRDVLRRARAGEEIILASYCPFIEPSPFREYGPVYVLADPSAEVVALDCFPVSNGMAPDYFGASLVIRAYDQIHDICAAAMTTPEAAPAEIRALLSRPEVKFVDARFATFGCFACRFIREGSA